MILLDGKKLANKITKQIRDRSIDITRSFGFKPGLVVILVGENSASEVYVRNKRLVAEKVGFESYERKLDLTISEASLIKIINEYNLDNNIDGILVQLPLPSHINTSIILDTVNPDKDVDGFNSYHAGLLANGRPSVIPCTPLGCLNLIKEYFDDISGSRSLVIGRSNIVGRPMSALLLNENTTVTTAHSKTRDLPEICKMSDIVISAIGKPKIIKSSWLKEGSIVLDVGINYIDDIDGKKRLVGDVDFTDAAKVVKAISPVPGGVGPMTIASLLSNTLKLAVKRRGVKIKF